MRHSFKRCIIIYSFFVLSLCATGLAQDSGSPSLQSVLLSNVDVQASVKADSGKPPGTFVFKVLDAYWVWRKHHQFSEVGTPAIRVVFSDGLDQRLLLDSILEEEDVFLVSRKQRRITVDLLASTGRVVLRTALSGQIFSVELQFRVNTKTPQLVRGSTCENYSVELEGRDGVSEFPFLGVDCLEQENTVIVSAVRPGKTTWLGGTGAFGVDPQSRLLRQSYRKSGFLGNSVRLGLVTAGGSVSRVHLKVKEKEPPRDPHFNADFGGQLAFRTFSGSRQLDDRRWLYGMKSEFRQENQFYNLRSFIEARALFEEFADFREHAFDLREGYISWHPFDAMRIKLGKQISAWGRADEINPTDAFTPRRLGMLLIDASSEQKTGQLLGELRWTQEKIGTLAFLMNPYLIPTDIFINGDRLERTRRTRQSQWGAGMRWDREWDIVETGVSFYNGLDPNGNIGLNRAFSLTQEFRRMAMVGVDAVLAADRFALRTEIARTWPLGRDYRIGEKRPELFAVGGFERQWDDGGGGIITQVIAKKIFHLDQGTFANTPFEAAETASRRYHLQNSEHMLAFSARVARSFWNDRFEAELFALKEWTTDNYFLRPKLRFTPKDHWKIQLGYEYYGGDDAGIFSFVRKNELGFLEVSRFF